MNSVEGRPPWRRLSGFYLFYFAALGALLPYWSVYLKGIGFNEAVIGQAMAALMLSKVVAPNVWGWLADRRGRRMGVIRFASLAGALLFSFAVWAREPWQIVLVMLAFGFFWHASLPQFEAVTMSHLRGVEQRYARIRLWGSIGFILTVAGLGAWYQRHPLDSLPFVLLLLYVGIWLTSLLVPEPAATPPHERDGESLRQVLRARPAIAVLLVACFLVQVGHGPYYTFFTLYLEEFGYGRGLIGGLWALGVVAEIVLFLWLPRLMPRVGVWRLFVAALALTTGRWLLIALLPQNLPLLLFAQLLHAASFGVVHAVAIHLIHCWFTPRTHGRGQALYSSLGFGAGGALGSWLAGLLWDAVSPGSTFVMSAVVSGVAWLLAWRWLPRRI